MGLRKKFWETTGVTVSRMNKPTVLKTFNNCRDNRPEPAPSSLSVQRLRVYFRYQSTKGGLVNFRHSFAVLCLTKSQRGWGTAEHTKGRGKTSLTTTEIQGGCTTIYNLPSLLCDSRGGWREEQREGGDTDSDGGWPVNSRAEEETIVFFPLTGALCDQHTG